MSSFTFNKLYVIESLQIGDKLTGTELYNDLLKWKEFEHDGKFKAELLTINNKAEFFNLLNSIKQECVEQKCFPMIHLEIHGSSEHDGLVLKSKELVSWNDIYESLIEINSIIGNNLFLTLAVCHGAYLMQLIKLDKPAPFWGFIGSFDSIKVSDLMIRYYEFYKEFFNSFNLNLAFYKLRISNPDIPSTYKFISSEETFKIVYNNYLKENTSEKGIEERKKQVRKDEKLIFVNRKHRRNFEKKFAKEIRNTRDKYYKKHSKIFFMLEKFPKNRKRFNVKTELKK